MSVERNTEIKNKSSIGYKLFILALVVIWIIALILRLSILPQLLAICTPLEMARIILGLVIIPVGIYGYIRKDRRLTILFFWVYLALGIVNAFFNVKAFISLLELYPLKDLITQMSSASLGIVIRFLFCYIAYKYIPSKSVIE